ncbi:DGQHR domain-containing protein [bacterium]|nr:DGQHR domain-containing protein [bacterium]
MYTTSFKVRDLLIPNFYSVERLDPDDANDGYQRVLNQGRAKKLAKYIVTGQDTRDAFLPTSVFLATDKSISFNTENNTIEFDIDDVGPFSVVDGQHRVEGLKLAAAEDPRVLDFELPVNIAVKLPHIHQMCHFLIVNTTQKSVDKSVEQRINARLTQILTTEDIPSLPKWILNTIKRGEDDQALRFVDFLDSTHDSPWFNKVRMANQSKDETTVNQHSFVKALKKYFLTANNPILTTQNEQTQQKIFLNYWKAVVNELGADDDSVLFKTNGVELFSRFSVPFLEKLHNTQDWRVPTMEELLRQVFDNVEGEFSGVGHSDFWVRGGKASGMNSGAINAGFKELVQALHRSNSPGKALL